VSIPVYDAAELRRAVCFTHLIEPLRVAFGEFSHGRAQQVMAALWPARLPEDGNVLIKAGCITGHDIFVVKAAPWFRSNHAAGRPQGGLVTAFDASTGYPVAIFADEHYLSDIRTAAAGALVADILAPPEATAATEPLVAAAWLHPGQHITAVGADDPGKCELKPRAFGRADLIAVDSREAAADNGSTRRALQAGALAPSDLTEIGEIGAYQRDPGAITIACLVGIGVQDVVAAETALAAIGAGVTDAVTPAQEPGFTPGSAPAGSSRPVPLGRPGYGRADQPHGLCWIDRKRGQP